MRKLIFFCLILVVVGTTGCHPDCDAAAVHGQCVDDTRYIRCRLSDHVIETYQCAAGEHCLRDLSGDVGCFQVTDYPPRDPSDGSTATGAAPDGANAAGGADAGPQDGAAPDATARPDSGSPGDGPRVDGQVNDANLSDTQSHPDACVPTCGGRQCGPDPSCGASCGTCSAGACVAGQCQAICGDGICDYDAEDCDSCAADCTLGPTTCSPQNAWTDTLSHTCAGHAEPGITCSGDRLCLPGKGDCCGTGIDYQSCWFRPCAGNQTIGSAYSGDPSLLMSATFFSTCGLSVADLEYFNLEVRVGSCGEIIPSGHYVISGNRIDVKYATPWHYACPFSVGDTFKLYWNYKVRGALRSVTRGPLACTPIGQNCSL
jgi:hypothetical protein